jgi:hypothetical protein
MVKRVGVVRPHVTVAKLFAGTGILAARRYF